MTRVRVEPRAIDQSRRKNDAFTLSATMPLTDTEHIPGLKSKKTSCGISKSCGLAVPPQYCRCFSILEVLIDNKLAVHESARQQFFCLKNQIAAFVTVQKGYC